MHLILAYLANAQPEILHSVRLRHNYGSYVGKMLGAGKPTEIKDINTYNLVADIYLIVSTEKS